MLIIKLLEFKYGKDKFKMKEASDGLECVESVKAY
jgi:hypothetical protein